MDRRTLILAGAAGLSGCGLWRREPRLPGEVSGTVTYAERFPLPVGAELRVTLYESTRGGEARFVAEQVVYRVERVPVRFRIPIDARVIDRKAGYTLVARIENAGRLLFVNPRPAPVLTLGNPALLEIVVSRVPAS